MGNFKYVELFAGIGGFRQGLDKLGGKCVLASEWDKFAQQSYSILYGDEHLYGDVTKINEKDVPDHDLLVFGMPCQAFSVAGKRLGFEDMRGTLYFEAMRIAREKKPKVLWMENVKGLVGHDSGRTLNVMAQAMCDIGYTIDFNVLNSKYFGVPQNRERIFMIGIRDDLIEQQPWKIEGTNVVAKGKRRISELGDVNTFNFDWPQQTEVTTRLRDILESDVDERYYLSEDKTAKLVAQLERENYDRETPVVIDPSQQKREGRARVYVDESPTITARDYKEPRMDDAIKRVYSAEGVSPTLTTMGGGHREPKIAEEVKQQITEDIRQIVAKSRPNDEIGISFKDNGDIRPHRMDAKKSGISELNINNENNASFTVTSAHAPKIYGETTKYRIRKLTPRECFRLQGFPDEAFDKLVEGGISNSQLYKQAGNAVTVNVINAIGRRLLPYL